MGDAAGEAADRLHLGGVRELRLEGPPLGGVLDQQLDHAVRAAAGLEAPRQPHRQRIAVAAPPVGVDAEGAAGVADAIDQRQEGVRLLVDVGAELDADQRLGRRVAEHGGERRVAFDDGAVDVAAADAVHGVREQLAIARLGDLQRLLLRPRGARAEAQQQRRPAASPVVAVGERGRLDAHVDQRRRRRGAAARWS